MSERTHRYGHIAAAFKQLRAKQNGGKGESQADMADRLHVSQAYASRLESGRQRPGLELLHRVSTEYREDFEEWAKLCDYGESKSTPVESERATLTRLTTAVERLISKMDQEKSPAEKLVDWLADFRRRTGRIVDVIPEGGVSALTHEAVADIITDTEELAIEQGWLAPLVDEKSSEVGKGSRNPEPNHLSK